MKSEILLPDWPAPDNVHALITTRIGGVSLAPFDSFNLGQHVGDDREAVDQNRNILSQMLPSRPCWLNQVHGHQVIDLDGPVVSWAADGAVCRSSGKVLAIMTADCLPLMLTTLDGSVLGVAHAGWRGLCAGIIERTILAMKVSSANILAYMGPAISQPFFEVGPDVFYAFLKEDEASEKAFIPGRPGKWLADLYELARQRLAQSGVNQVYGGQFCTYRDSTAFFSYRREGRTGRQAVLLWKTS
ncbi:MAG: peptidoglycan editing factor PgeF [Proteobacteria bacterium]|nr:peptidoglycan editing factor PgeF [Pseudomonadota bacterium]MDE3207326.1 peptidoglycan editing factor PgeF [Pseudomonadota bacterium]